MKRFTVLLFLFSAALVINSCGTPSHSAIRGAITLPSESDSKLYLIPNEFRGGTTMGTLSRLRDYPFSSLILVTDEDRLLFEDLLSKAKKKKHFQQKLVYDYSLMYFLFVFVSNKLINKLLLIYRRHNTRYEVNSTFNS